jgi:hypothetical protein
MAKLIRLAEPWRKPFRELLDASPTFGPLVTGVLDLNIGRLEVWVPDAIESVPLQNLRRDPFYPEEDFGQSEATDRYFEEYLGKDPQKFLIADTRRTTAESSIRGNPKVPWFTCDSPSTPGKVNTCVYGTGAEFSEQALDDLLAEANQFPRTVVLTSLPAGVALISGCHLAPESPLLTALVHRVEHVLLGVFDETSYMVWSRG